jgi:hypothetical protein
MDRGSGLRAASQRISLPGIAGSGIPPQQAVTPETLGAEEKAKHEEAVQAPVEQGVGSSQ